MNIKRTIIPLVFLALSVSPVADEHVITTSSHRLTEVANGVYLAQTTAPLFNSNALVIVNEEDVVVVDSHLTPAKARDLVASIKSVTTKPITTLINSHFHWDHAHGNQVFDDGVQIIGHEYTRMKLAGTPLEETQYVIATAGNKATLARIREMLTNASEEDRPEIQKWFDLYSQQAEDWKEIAPIPPDTTLNDRMTLFRGSREIQIHFFGRAHTGGDITVYLPAEKLAFTGDMMLQGPSFLGDGYVDEWVETLENLKGLAFETIVPGHGNPFTDRDLIGHVQAYYADLWEKVAAMHEQGIPVADAARDVDMTNHASTLGIRRKGVDPQAVGRIYARLDGAD
ncbi:MAG: MBL fold metallo-hydrolase [Pseudomonadales bacterium]|nr:MBL fold metallo-hydrolase [Pseudomonadales bacterium]